MLTAVIDYKVLNSLNIVEDYSHIEDYDDTMSVEAHICEILSEQKLITVGTFLDGNGFANQTFDIYVDYIYVSSDIKNLLLFLASENDAKKMSIEWYLVSTILVFTKIEDNQIKIERFHDRTKEICFSIVMHKRELLFRTEVFVEAIKSLIRLLFPIGYQRMAEFNYSIYDD